jgi:hypothetical protein
LFLPQGRLERPFSFLEVCIVTVSTTKASDVFPGNGIAAGFSCEWRIFDDTDVLVSLVDKSTGADTPLVLNTDYTIAGSGDQAGFTVSTASPVDAGHNLYVRRALAYVQPTDFTNQGAFFPTMHEDAMDRLEMQIQQLADENDRALRLPGGLSDVDGQIPRLEPLMPLVVNADGTGVEVGDTTLTGDLLLRPNLAATTGASLVGFTESGTGAVARTVNDKLLEQTASIADFGANTSFTDNLGQVGSAVTAAGTKGTLLVPPGEFAMSAPPTNTYGIDVAGSGKLMVADAYGGAEQFNTYRGKKPIAYGKEYLWPVYNVMQATHIPIRCYLYGDSTVQGGSNFLSSPFFLTQLLPNMVSAKGVKNYFAVTNRGVGGSNLSTWNPAPDIGVNSATPAHLVILKSGINDASFPNSTRLDTFRNNLRAGLQAIRNVTNGDVTSTSILLVGPNPTIDKQNHQRNAYWYEQIRGIYEAAARDFKCAYFDTYQYLQDVEWARGTWINDDTAIGQNPVSLHPRDVGNSWIWGAIVDFIFGGSEIYGWRSNNFHNRSVYFGFPNAKNPPTWYPTNYDPGVTIEVAATSDGFPFNGILVTTKSAEGPLRQMLYPLDESGYVASRSSSTNSGIYGEWKGVPKNMTLLNGWTTFGSPYGAAKATATEQGLICLEGMIKPGTTTAGTTLFTLPADMRPTTQKIIPCSSESAVCQIEVFANGNVQLRTGTPASFLSLDGATFAQN